MAKEFHTDSIKLENPNTKDADPIMIEYVLNKINDSISRVCSKYFNVKSLWIFRHAPEIKALKTWFYHPITNQNRYVDQIRHIVEEQIISEEKGSIGKAYQKYKNSQDQVPWDYIENTFSAKEGTVIETDLILGHQTVLFIPFYYGNKVLAILLVSLSKKENSITDESGEFNISIQNKIYEEFKNADIPELIHFAYQNEISNDSIQNFEKAVTELEKEAEDPDTFLESKILKPLLNDFNQGISLIPYIEITGDDLKKTLIDYSDIVYDKLREQLSFDVSKSRYPNNSIINEFKCHLDQHKEIKYFGPKDRNVQGKGNALNYTDDCETDEVLSYSIHYSKSDVQDQDSIINSDLISEERLSTELQRLLSKLDLDVDNETKMIIQKKFISEKLDNYFQNAMKGVPYYLTLNWKEIDELISCNLKIYVQNNKDYLDLKSLYSNSHEIDTTDKKLKFIAHTDTTTSPFESNSYIEKFIEQRYLYYKIILERNHTVHEANKAAKAAIMSRNMSHNLGSHVMFYIKQKLESVNKVFNSDTLDKLIMDIDLNKVINDMEKKNISDDAIKIIQEKLKEELGAKLPEKQFLLGLGRFLAYLQERQDFIATVATNYIPYNTSINFKDAIFDELKPELRAKRHDGITSTSNLLLDYIARSEGFNSSDDIIIQFKGEDGNLFDGNEDVPSDLRNFNVALPGGYLGRQAFFSIMENIIRNTAKHNGKKAKDGKLRFRFDRLDDSDINEIVGYSLRQGEEINDEKINTKEINQCYKNHKNDLYYLGITSILSENVSTKHLEIIKNGLQRKYIYAGEMDEEFKGLKEMRISAAWMRRQKLDYLIPITEPPAVAIRKNNNNLQYIICLPKPKKVAIISSSQSTNLSLKDVVVFKRKDIVNELSKVSQYELVVYEGNNKDDQFEEIRKHTGSRLYATEDSITNETTLNELYNNWLKNAFKTVFDDYSDINLSIIDESSPFGNDSEIKIPRSNLSNKILDTKELTTDDSERFNNCILFKTHYPGQAIENDNRGLYCNAFHVEAISGGNSTDRLLRHDERCFEWYCKHMSAGLSRVAIFDERIYNFIVPKEGASDDEITKDFDGIKSDIEEFDIKFKLFKKGYSDSFVNQILNDYHNNTENNNKEKFKAAIVKNLLKDYSKTWQYREKGIWAFNIVIKDNDKLDIIGYNAPPTRPIGKYSKEYKEVIIAHISKTKTDDVIVEWAGNNGSTEKEVFKNKFEFISIHQGLLDKIYEAFSIEDENGKELVTKAIFEAFSSKSNDLITFSNNRTNTGKSKYFLPQFIIHSGRSKPNKKDMPQHLPFLQFSSIEHAIRDCKHTLTELLYSAHYEQ